MASKSTPCTAFDESFAKIALSTPNVDQLDNREKFALFFNLPIELRLKIWSQTLDDLPGRVLALQEISPGSKHIPARFFCKRPVPALAHVCSETSSFIRSSNCFFKSGILHTQIYFDVSKDTILLGPHFRIKQLKRLGNSAIERTQLKSLVLEYTFKRNYHRIFNLTLFECGPFGWDCWEIRRILDAFPALEKLIFVPHHDEPGEASDSYRGEGRFMYPKRSEWLQQEWETHVAWARSGYEEGLEKITEEWLGAADRKDAGG